MSEFEEANVFDEAVDVTETISENASADVSAQVDKINQTIKSSIPDGTAQEDFLFKSEGGKFQLEVNDKVISFGEEKVSFGEALTSPNIDSVEIADTFTKELGIKGTAGSTFSEQIRDNIENSPKRNAIREVNEFKENVEEIKKGFSDSSASEQKINEITSSDGDATLQEEAKNNKEIEKTDKKVKDGAKDKTKFEKFKEGVKEKLGSLYDKLTDTDWGNIAKNGLILFFTYEFLDAHRNGKSGCFRYDNTGKSCKVIELTCNKNWKTQFNACGAGSFKCIQGPDKKNVDPNCPNDSDCDNGKGDCSIYCTCDKLQCNPDSKTRYQYQCVSGMSIFDSFCDVAGTIADIADSAFGTGTGLVQTLLKWLKWIALIIVIALVIFVIIKLFMIIFKKKEEPEELQPQMSQPVYQPQMITRQPYVQAYYPARIQGRFPQMVQSQPQMVQSQPQMVESQPQMVESQSQMSQSRPVFFRPQQSGYNSVQIPQSLKIPQDISQQEFLQPPPSLEISQSQPQYEVLQPQYDPLDISTRPVQSRISQVPQSFDQMSPQSFVPITSQPSTISRNIKMGPVMVEGTAPSFRPVEIGSYGRQIATGATQRFGRKKYRISHRKF